MTDYSYSFPDSLKLDLSVTLAFRRFIQMMANRRAQGAARYGDKPNREQCYLTRLDMELKQYKKTGNLEQLLNIANYAFLESQAPENVKYHHDPNAKSATRRKMGGNIR